MIKKVASSESDPSRLKIENIGIIENLDVKFDPSGDIVEIIGPNGSGKTTALNAICAAFGRGNKLQRRDGVKGAGTFVGLGKEIRVTQRTMVDGELTRPVLDDEYSLVDVVNPKEVDPAKADGRVLRTILRLAKAPANAELFHPLFATVEEFNSIVDPDSLKTDDVVQMAKNIKRDIDRKALAIEREAESHATEALALEKSLEGIDLENRLDLEEIKKQHETAVRSLTSFNAQLKRYREMSEEAVKLRQQIEEAEKLLETPLADLEAEVSNCSAMVEGCKSVIGTIDSQIAELQKKREEAVNQMTLFAEKTASAQSKVISAKGIAGQIDGMKSRLFQCDNTAKVTPEEITEAEQAVEKLRQQMTDAELQNRNAEKVDRLADEKAKAKLLGKQGEKFRDAAKGAEGVLSELIGKLGSEIYVGSDDKDNVRLMTKHPERGEIYFLDLSKGERLDIVFGLQLKAVGPGGMFEADQECWEGYDPDNRDKFYEKVRKTGALVFVAQCDRGELRARSWSLDKAAAAV